MYKIGTTPQNSSFPTTFKPGVLKIPGITLFESQQMYFSFSGLIMKKTMVAVRHLFTTIPPKENLLKPQKYLQSS